MEGLTPKQALFVMEYVIDLNATQAAIRAGYSEDAAQQIGSENLSKPVIAAKVQEQLDAKAARNMLSADRVIQEQMRIAFSDVRKLVDSTGSPRPIQELTADEAACISGLDIVNIGNSNVGEGQVMKLKIADKQKALDSLLKHLGADGVAKLAFTDTQGNSLSVDPIEASKEYQRILHGKE